MLAFYTALHTRKNRLEDERMHSGTYEYTDKRMCDVERNTIVLTNQEQQLNAQLHSPVSNTFNASCTKCQQTCFIMSDGKGDRHQLRANDLHFVTYLICIQHICRTIFANSSPTECKHGTVCAIGQAQHTHMQAEASLNTAKAVLTDNWYSSTR